MVVNHINTFPYGGAAIAATRLHRQLINSGISSRFLFRKNDRGTVPEFAESLEPFFATSKPRNPISKFFDKRRVNRIRRSYDDHLAKRNDSLELFSMAELTEPSVLRSEQFENQILHLHWLAFTADYPSFFSSIGPTTPVVWTLHDMNPMTGGCHYSNQCQQYRFGCGHCPQLLNPSSNDLSRLGFRIKKKALSRINLTIVAPSRWMLDLAKESSIFPKSTRFEQIKLGFDLNEFRPLGKTTARRFLLAQTDKVVIGFGAESIANHRKGFDLLLKALGELNCKEQIECYVFGSGEFETGEAKLPAFKNFGIIKDADVMRNFYAACDMVIVPSREDNQPQVGLEAMACGTPVIGFDAGGIAEYVRPGHTGRLARAEDYSDLALQIERLVADKNERQFLSKRCRQMMEKEFDIEVQAAKYADLYQQLLMPNKNLDAA